MAPRRMGHGWSLGPELYRQISGVLADRQSGDLNSYLVWGTNCPLVDRCGERNISVEMRELYGRSAVRRSVPQVHLLRSWPPSYKVDPLSILRPDLIVPMGGRICYRCPLGTLRGCLSANPRKLSHFIAQFHIHRLERQTSRVENIFYN
jgi:hypothetical protein